jgi:hypothetical protein
MSPIDRQFQFAAFGCSRSVANLFQSSVDSREWPLFPKSVFLTSSANGSFQSGAVGRLEKSPRAPLGRYAKLSIAT